MGAGRGSAEREGSRPAAAAGEGDAHRLVLLGGWRLPGGRGLRCRDLCRHRLPRIVLRVVDRAGGHEDHLCARGGTNTAGNRGEASKFD